MAGIPVYEIREQRVQQSGVALELLRHSPVHEIAHAVAHHQAVFLSAVKRQSSERKRMVDSRAEVIYCVDQRPVEIEDCEFIFHVCKYSHLSAGGLHRAGE